MPKINNSNLLSEKGLQTVNFLLGMLVEIDSEIESVEVVQNTPNGHLRVIVCFPGLVFQFGIGSTGYIFECKKQIKAVSTAFVPVSFV